MLHVMQVGPNPQVRLIGCSLVVTLILHAPALLLLHRQIVASQ